MEFYSLSAVAAAITVFASSAGAAVVTQTKIETTDAQSFSFALSAPKYAANSASMLTLTAPGDFNAGVLGGETVSISIEGVNYGTFSPTSSQAYGVIN